MFGFCCIFGTTVVHLLNAVLSSQSWKSSSNNNTSLGGDFPNTCICLSWHFSYFLRTSLDKCSVVQLHLRTETELFLAFCRQRLQNSHIYKLFNFQMLIKSLAPSAGCASATYKILEASWEEEWDESRVPSSASHPTKHCCLAMHCHSSEASYAIPMACCGA